MAQLHAVIVPRWGSTMEEGKVTDWLIKPGTSVAPGDEILEIETTKLTNVVEAQVSGTLLRTVAEVGQTLVCGSLLGVIGPADASDTEIEAFIQSQAQILREEDAGPVGPKEIEVEGRRFTYLEEGDGGTPIVFVHGFSGDSSNWAMLQPPLSRNRRTVALDLPGHGGSTKEVGDGSARTLAGDLRTVLDALGIDRAHFVAHSLGGAVVLQLTAIAPELMASAVLLAPVGLSDAINMDYPLGLLKAQRQREMRTVLSLLVSDEEAISRRMVDTMQRYLSVDGVEKALKAIIDANFPDGKVLQAPAQARETLRGRSLLIWGDADKVVAIPDLARVAAGAEVRILKDVGHLTQLEAADRVAGKIANFLISQEKSV